MADDVLDADLGGLFLALLEELGHLAPVDLGEGGFALLDHAQSGDGEFEGDFEFRLGRGLAGAFAEGGEWGYNDGGWRSHGEMRGDVIGWQLLRVSRRGSRGGDVEMLRCGDVEMWRCRDVEMSRWAEMVVLMHLSPPR